MSEENVADAAEVENVEAATEEKQAAELNINDLAAIKSIVEIATQRGAFRANELEAVGKTFNKLETFLQSVASQKEE